MMTEAGSIVRYDVAFLHWEEQGRVEITSNGGETLATFPVSFLVTGRVGTFKFVLEQLLSCYDCSEGELLDERSDIVTQHEMVYAGKFRFTGEAKALSGPRGKYRRRPPTASSASSTMSNSRRSTANQAKFREALCARDSMCLVTEDNHTDCTACHILPQSRPEYYTEVLGYDPGYLFLARYGLLLRDDIHHAFDRGEIGFYPSGSDLIIHVFRPRKAGNTNWKEYHGKVLNPSRFRSDEADRPDIRLLLFHYQQCAMMRFRGFWTGGVSEEE